MQSTDGDVDNDVGINFWEPLGYSQTVKRAENANKLCNELSLLIQERSNIEKQYANNLRKFAIRMEMCMKTGLEYGSGNNILSGLSKEAEDTAALHSDMAAALLNPVQFGIKDWQKEHFHKSTISTSVKEIKALDAEFENAQKNWLKQYKLVKKCKKDYFNACKSVRSLQVQVQNAINDPSGTPEQQVQRNKERRKIEDKLRKATREEEKSKSAYENAVNSLRDATPRYIDDMTAVFVKSQEGERKRINFFKDQAMKMLEVLNILEKPVLPEIFTSLASTIAKVDADADLKKWSFAHGVDMPANFPSFEEYRPEVSGHLGGKKKSTIPDGNSGVTLTSIKTISSPGRDATEEESPSHAGYGQESSRYSASINGGANEPAASLPSVDSAPYPDLVDDGKPGVRIRALYDYTGVESDELSFATGDEFEKLEDEDEQGWCKGRKDGRVGLYPANYVEVI